MSKHFLLVLIVIVSLLFTACAQPASQAVEEPAGDQQAAAEPVTAEQATGPREAPMLAEMVAAGELAPLEERLPTEP